MEVLNHIEPKNVFYFFEAISNIPRGSGNEKAVSDFVVRFAKDKGLYCRQDDAFNVIVKKPATAGYENAPTVILQGHMDMVCEKNGDTEHDFLVHPLELYIDGDFIRAKGTTLGADNGIAVAMALALLDADNIAHPSLECVFTADEEAGMGGVKTLDPYDLEGRLFINMDSEEEGHLLVSCSGGQRVEIALPADRENAPEFGRGYLLQISGLKGGHSGSDIHLERANANKLMGRVLLRIMDEFENRLVSVDGGLMENAISREASAVLWLRPQDSDAVSQMIADLQDMFYSEYQHSDGAITLKLSPLSEHIQRVFTQDTAEKIKNILLLIPYGVIHQSVAMPGLVESSSNIGVVRTEEEKISFCNATRSSVKSRKEEILNQIRSLAALAGAQCKETNDYPGWNFNPDSKLLPIFQNAYKEKYGKDAVVTAIHAGLECGIFSEKMNGLDMISIGPNMFDVHTPEERLSISSTARTWDYLKEVLARIK